MTRFRRRGVGWHTPASLNALMDEVEAWDPIPRTSDGTVGDTAHSARLSDHNPDENGVVRALDAGESDDAQGDQLFEALRASKDDRIAYVIHDGFRFLGAKYPLLGTRQPWVNIPYTGLNAHLKHNHTSVNEAYDDDGRPWHLFTTTEESMIPITKTSSAGDIQLLQDRLAESGSTLVKADGVYGEVTAAAVKGRLLKYTAADEAAPSSDLANGWVVNANMWNGLTKEWVLAFVPKAAVGVSLQQVEDMIEATRLAVPD